MNDLFAPDKADWFQSLTQIGAAILLPLLIGLERFLRRKPIDFRPFVVISVVACAIMIGTVDFIGIGTSDESMIDPTRVMQGVLTGIGFLGAGAMYRDGDFVKGAGSASTIWSAGAIGLMCGIGEIWLAGLVTVAILAVMIIGEPFTSKWDNAHKD